MSNWEKAGKLSSFKEGCQWLVDINNRPIALFKYENNFLFSIFWSVFIEAIKGTILKVDPGS